MKNTLGKILSYTIIIVLLISFLTVPIVRGENNANDGPPFKIEILEPEENDEYEETEEIKIKYRITKLEEAENKEVSNIEYLVDGFVEDNQRIHWSEVDEDEYVGEFTWIVVGEPREAELGIRLEDYDESKETVNIEVLEVDTPSFWKIIFIFGIVGTIIVSVLVRRDNKKDKEVEEKI